MTVMYQWYVHREDTFFLVSSFVFGIHSNSINNEEMTIKKLWAEVSNIDTRNALKKPRNPPNKKLFCNENDAHIANRQ